MFIKSLAVFVASAALMLGAPGAFAAQGDQDHSAHSSQTNQADQAATDQEPGDDSATASESSGSESDQTTSEQQGDGQADVSGGSNPAKKSCGKHGGKCGQAEGQGGKGGKGCCCKMKQGQSGQGGHGGHGGQGRAGGAASSGASGDDSASSVAFSAVSDKMYRDMSIAYSGSADADFAKLMIAEQKAAVDLARIALAFGKDPEVRKLAEAAVKARESELEAFNQWVAKTKK